MQKGGRGVRLLERKDRHALTDANAVFGRATASVLIGAGYDNTEAPAHEPQETQRAANAEQDPAMRDDAH